jgi:negative regulator of sigma-B (phosphoserine phosphatase)
MGKISRGVDYYFSKKSFGKNKPCADLGTIQENKDHLFFAIADIAGHGDQAHRLSLVVEKYLVKNLKNDLVDLMYGLHALLKGSRGAVGLAGFLTKKTGAVEYVGIGNISIRKFGEKNIRIVSNEGIIGYVIRTLKIERLQLAADDVLLLYTDGIRDYFTRSECPKGLFDKDAKHIVNGIMDQFYKGNDDAACIAIRYKND